MAICHHDQPFEFGLGIQVKTLEERKRSFDRQRRQRDPLCFVIRVESCVIWRLKQVRGLNICWRTALEFGVFSFLG